MRSESFDDRQIWISPENRSPSSRRQSGLDTIWSTNAQGGSPGSQNQSRSLSYQGPATGIPQGQGSFWQPSRGSFGASGDLPQPLTFPEAANSQNNPLFASTYFSPPSESGMAGPGGIIPGGNFRGGNGYGVPFDLEKLNQYGAGLRRHSHGDVYSASGVFPGKPPGFTGNRQAPPVSWAGALSGAANSSRKGSYPTTDQGSDGGNGGNNGLLPPLMQGSGPMGYGSGHQGPLGLDKTRDLVDQYFEYDPHGRVKVTIKLLEERFFEEEQYLGDLYQLPRFPIEHSLRNYQLVLVGFKAGRIDVFYLPSTNEFSNLKVGDLVIVEADRGRDLGKIFKMNVSIDEARLMKFLQFQEQQAALSDSDNVSDLSVKNIHSSSSAPPALHFPKSIIALALSNDVLQVLNKKQDEEKACRLCLAKISSAIHNSTEGAHASTDTNSNNASTSTGTKTNSTTNTNVNGNSSGSGTAQEGNGKDNTGSGIMSNVLDLMQMKLIDAEYQFDRKKLIFYYSTSKRIDFRDLVRELFRIYKTRIWMCAAIGKPYVTYQRGSLDNSVSPLSNQQAGKAPVGQPRLLTLEKPSTATFSDQMTQPQYVPAQMIDPRRGVSSGGSVPHGYQQNYLQGAPLSAPGAPMGASFSSGFGEANRSSFSGRPVGSEHAGSGASMSFTSGFFPGSNSVSGQKRSGSFSQQSLLPFDIDRRGSLEFPPPDLTDMLREGHIPSDRLGVVPRKFMGGESMEEESNNEAFVLKSLVDSIDH